MQRQPREKCWPRRRTLSSVCDDEPARPSTSHKIFVRPCESYEPEGPAIAGEVNRGHTLSPKRGVGGPRAERRAVIGIAFMDTRTLESSGFLHPQDLPCLYGVKHLSFSPSGSLFKPLLASARSARAQEALPPAMIISLWTPCLYGVKHLSFSPSGSLLHPE